MGRTMSRVVAKRSGRVYLVDLDAEFTEWATDGEPIVRAHPVKADGTTGKAIRMRYDSLDFSPAPEATTPAELDGPTEEVLGLDAASEPNATRTLPPLSGGIDTASAAQLRAIRSVILDKLQSMTPSTFGYRVLAKSLDEVSDLLTVATFQQAAPRLSGKGARDSQGNPKSKRRRRRADRQAHEAPRSIFRARSHTGQVKRRSLALSAFSAN